MKGSGKIRIGVGGWNFEPWRGVFYPDKWPQAKELEYAASKLTAIEINSTYYGSQKPETFRKWASQAPDGFKFSVKASRFSTNRKVLAEGADSVKRFLTSGVTELGDRLGPLLWQFAPTKKFDEADFLVLSAHDSFRDAAFIALIRKFNVAVVCAEHETYPGIADVTSDFVYLRLQKGKDTLPAGYPPKELDAWAKRFRTYASGGVPKDLDQVDAKTAPKPAPRDVFAYVIHEGKVRAPAAAMELIKRTS